MDQPKPAKPRIRKIEIRSNDELDDQIWPVNLAIIILAGFVTGLVLATSRFDEPEIIHNAFFRLGSIALTLVAWFVGLRLLRAKRKMRRRLRICVLFSLLVHLWLLMGLGVGYYELVVDRADSEDRNLEELDLNVVPDYDPRQLERPDARRDFERPVETESPKATDPDPPERRQVERPTPPKKRSEIEPEVPPREQPDPTQLERREISAPRRDEAPANAQISRQDMKVRPEPDRPIPQPKIEPARRPPPTMMAKVDNLQQRRLDTPRQQRRLIEERPETTVRREVVRMERKATQRQPRPEQPATPLPTQRAIRPAEVPRTEAKAPEPTPRSEEPRAVAPEPRVASVRRRADAPVASKQSADPTPQVAVRVNRAPTRQRELDHRPDIATTPNRIPARRPSQADLAVTAVESPSQAASASAPRRASLEPASQAGVSKRRPELGPVAPTRMPADFSGPASSTPIARNPLRRLDRAGNPTLEPAPGPADRVARRNSLAPKLAAMLIEQPETSEPAGAHGGRQPSPTESHASQQPHRAAGLPGNLASQALAGAVSPLKGQGSPSPPAAARRVRASRQGSEGIDVTPTAVGMLPRARPGTDLPSAATPVENASMAGAGGLAANSAGSDARLEAGSNTAVRRSAPGSPAGRAISAAGSATPARNPGPVGVMAGRARVAGGGVPALATNTGTPQLGRSATAAAGLAGLGGRVAESIPGLEAGGPSIARGPAQPGPNATATAVARASGGGLPTGIPGGGPPGDRQGEAGPGSLAAGRAIGAPGIGRAGGAGTAAGPVLDGGIPAPGRRPGRIPIADLVGNVPEMTGDAATDGGTSTAGPSGLPEAGTLGVKRQRSGLPGKLTGRMPVDGATAAGPVATTPAAAVGPRRLPQGSDRGPSLAARIGGAALGKTNRPGLPSGMADLIGTSPGPAAGSPGEPTRLATLVMTPGVGDVGRRSGGLPVRIAATPGPGGLSRDPRPAVGLPSRRARPESDVMHTIARRFVIGRSGGDVAIDGRAQELPAEAFRQRDPVKRAEEARKRGGNPESERAVEMGLDFLARTQFADGHWGIHEFPRRTETWPGESRAAPDATKLVPLAERILADRLGNAREQRRLGELVEKHKSAAPLDKDELDDLAMLVRTMTLAAGDMRSDSAATGLALLAFLGAGYTHTDGKHRATVARAVDWLVANQQPNGDLFSKPGGSEYAWLYSHGIATIALCEAYGMTRDAKLQEPARKAIQFVVDSQNPELGGWRYRPREESDTSVSGWQLMALKSAQMAGLEVPEATLDNVGRWLQTARASGGGTQYVYNPNAEDSDLQRHGREPTRAMTAEALLMKLYLGTEPNDPEISDGADLLGANLPEVGTTAQPTRDAYYWYYATQVMFQMQGDRWKAWDGRLRPLLVSGQVRQGPMAGSWNPGHPIPDKWGSAGGRHYVSTMNLLMLEVYYRHLPLYKTLREE